MSNFPLYDSLMKEETSVEDLTNKQKNELVKLVKTLDEIGFELIYTLIRVFQLENSEDKSTFKVPYGGKFIKNDIKFDLDLFPIKLKHIIYIFVIKHTTKMKEAKDIDSLITI